MGRTLNWSQDTRAPGETEIAVGTDETYLIAADDRHVVLTRFTTGAGQVPETTQAALNAILLANPLPDAEAVTRQHMRRVAQQFEDGQDLDGQPAWQHGKAAPAVNEKTKTMTAAELQDCRRDIGVYPDVR
jgi:hypothetical protein